MRSLSLLLAFVGLVFFSSPSVAEFGIEKGKRVWYVEGQELDGGMVEDFIKRVKDFRQKNITVVIKGQCQSSCTLYTALLKQGLLCARPGTKMVFHRPYYMTSLSLSENGEIKSFIFGGYASEKEPLVHHRFWTTYPVQVRREILKHSPGGLPGVGREISLPAKAFGIPTC